MILVGTPSAWCMAIAKFGNDVKAGVNKRSIYEYGLPCRNIGNRTLNFDVQVRSEQVVVSRLGDLLDRRQHERCGYADDRCLLSLRDPSGQVTWCHHRVRFEKVEPRILLLVSELLRPPMWQV